MEEQKEIAPFWPLRLGVGDTPVYSRGPSGTRGGAGACGSPTMQETLERWMGVAAAVNALAVWAGRPALSNFNSLRCEEDVQ